MWVFSRFKPIVLTSLMRFCALLLGLFFAAIAPARRLPIKVFTTANGMPRNSARCMVPDASGMLWICTSEGLVRFDGYQFHVFGPEHGLPSRAIVDLVPSGKGGYWVLTSAGVCRIAPRSQIGEPCRLLENNHADGYFEPTSLLESEDGNVWVATTRAVFHVSADERRLEATPVRIPSDKGLFQSTAIAPDGSLLIGSAALLYRWRPGQEPRDISGNLAAFAGATEIVSAGTEVWIVSPARLYKLSDWRAEGDPIVESWALPPSQFGSFLRRRDGTMWLAGRGMVRIEIGGSAIREIEDFSKREGLPGVTVVELIEDAQGNLWGSTDGDGIFRIADSGFTIYSEDDGLSNARIAAIFESRRGEICVISTRFEHIRYQHPPYPMNSGWGWNQFGLQAHDGEWWLPSGAGLFRFPKVDSPQQLAARNPIAVYTDRNGLGGGNIFRMFEDSRSDLWIAAPPERLARWERTSGRFHVFTKEEGRRENDVVSAIRETKSGTIWIATFADVLRMRNHDLAATGGRFETISAFPNAQFPYIRDLYIDDAQRLWIATARYGLFRCDHPDDPHPVFQNYTTATGLSSDSVRSVIDDANGFIYAGTVRGIDRIDPTAPVGSGGIRHFDTADGVPDSEENAAFRDQRGHLWFGTLNGLAEFDPAKSRRGPPPQVFITRLRVRGEEIGLPWAGARSFHMDVAPEKNQFEIQYAGVDLGSVASLRYQYRLAGLDREWSAPVEGTSFHYASLPSGSFHFEVRAISADGQTGAPAVLDLDVQSPLWKRPWFIALECAFIAAIVALLVRYRVAHLLAMERLRTHLASDLHDDIGASLTQISILTELARRGGSRDVLEDIAAIAREMVANMSDIVWAINPRHDHFDALVHRMRRFASDTLGEIELEFDASTLPADLPVPLEFRRPFYLVFKEAVHNIASHSGASRASIRILVKDRALCLEVEDNGRGFDFGASRDGEGINSIQRRIGAIGGTVEWSSRPGRTRIVALLPLSRRPTVLGGKS
jgi:signal transduction histidine kinase/ligand-binding sensor domain-containing protein